MPATALDIGTYSIKIAIGRPGARPHLNKVFELLNPTKLAVPQDAAQQEQLTQVMKTLWHDYALPKGELRLSLPESVVSTKVIEMPPLSTAELVSAVSWQAERHIPIPKEDLMLEYQVLSKTKKNNQEVMQVLLIGVRRPILDRYLAMFADLPVDPALIETQSLSIFRSTAVAPSDPPTLIAHLGNNELILIVVRNGQLNFVVSHLGGSSLLTKTLHESINLDEEAASQYVRTYGLDETQFGGKVRQLLMPHVALWFKNIQLSMQYFANQYQGEVIKRIIFSGGAVLLPGLVAQASADLGVEILIADPISSVSMGNIKQLNTPTAYGVVLGLMEQEDL